MGVADSGLQGVREIIHTNTPSTRSPRSGIVFRIKQGIRICTRLATEPSAEPDFRLGFKFGSNPRQLSLIVHSLRQFTPVFASPHGLFQSGVRQFTPVYASLRQFTPVRNTLDFFTKMFTPAYASLRQFTPVVWTV